MTISFARRQFPPVVIRHAVWLYIHFTLSYRDVEDLLAERGLGHCHGNLFLLTITHPPTEAAACDFNRLALRSRWLERPLLASCDNTIHWTGGRHSELRVPRVKTGCAKRFVARELEARWNGALEKVVAIERRSAELRAVAAARPRIDRAVLMRLAQDLPAAWNAPTTDTHTKQRLINILIHEIVCDLDDA
jgi:hypothetical protein